MKGVNQTAVDNFLGSLDKTLHEQAHYFNALADAKAYGWNDETLHAICKGIKKEYKK